MSWFMRRPRTKEPSKQIPHLTSPITEKVLEEMKDKVRPPKKKPRAKKT
jgi:hypothetical protein